MSTDPAIAALRATRAQQRAVQRCLRPVGLLLVGYWCWVCWHGSPGPGLTGHGLVVSVASAGFVIGALGARFTFRDAGNMHPQFLLVLLASSGVLLWAQPGGVGAAGLVACALLAGRRLPGRIGLPLVAAGFVALAVVAVLVGGNGPWALAGVVGFGGFYAMAYLANQLGAANEQAERLLTELERTRAAEARAAGLAERQRLAREMHDVLAHSLSGMMLQLEGARMLAAADVTDPRLPGAIERAHHLGSAGLTEASRAIGMLRDEELPGPELLPGLAERFQADYGVPCELTVTGPPHPLGSQARLAVYRVAQEALTNIAKHASPERVLMSLAYEPDGTRLKVEDLTVAVGPGAGAPEAGDSVAGAPGAGTASGTGPTLVSGVPGGGYGLAGMRERAELLGGDLVAAATGRGFLVELRVPS